MKNKAFIFDWSGTLSDSHHLFCKVCDLMFAELGRDVITSDEIRLNFTLPYMKFWNKYFPDLTIERQSVLYEKFVHQVGEPELFKGAKEIIAYLKKKGYKLFILSSDPISRLIPEVKRSGFAKEITEVIGNVHEKKDTIISLVKKFKLDKKATFYIGDTSGDVEAGKGAKVRTIGISWGSQHKDVLTKSKPDFLIDNIVEIKNIVEPE